MTSIDATQYHLFTNHLAVEIITQHHIDVIITRQAMERKESRGLHYTIDYPKRQG